jgi:ABC-type multidrug transport system fused ATPase/permease subunit
VGSAFSVLQSVRYNIGYGRIGSTDEEIEEAAKAAQLHSKVVGFPDGYDTRVGERGVRLSGGEVRGPSPYLASRS